MKEKPLSEQRKEAVDKHGEYRKALYVDDKYFRLLEEKGPIEAGKYRKEQQEHRESEDGGDGKPAFVYGGAAGAHRRSRGRKLNEIRDARWGINEQSVFTDNIAGQNMESKFNEFVLSKFDFLGGDSTDKKIVRTALRKSVLDYVEVLQSGLDKKDTFTQIFKAEDRLIVHLKKKYPDNDNAKNIADAVRLAAYSHNGWVKAGGEEFELMKNGGGETNQPKYKDVISGVDSMKLSAMQEYYKSVNKDGNTDVPENMDFDRLRRWGGFKKAALYAAMAAFPVAGAVTAGALTGGASVWIHALAGVAGFAGGTAAFHQVNKIGSDSGSSLYDLKKLAGLNELNKRLTPEGYLPRPDYNVVHGALRTLFGHKPPNKVRVQEVSRGDLHYILKRGELKEENLQKRIRLVAALLPIVTLGYLHKDSVLGLFRQPTDVVANTPVVPPEAVPVTTPDPVNQMKSFWQNFFTFDGTTMPGFDAPQIPNCYAPETLCTK